MKVLQLCRCFVPVVLLLILSTLIQSSTCYVYHGANRFFTVDVKGKTYLSLPHFIGHSTKLIFPKHPDGKFPLVETFTTSHGDCGDAGILHFKFIIDRERYLRGEIKVKHGEIKAYLYQNCPGRLDDQQDYYGTINFERHNSVELQECFEDGHIPFAAHDTNSNAMDFEVSAGSFGCPAFFVLPKNVHLEDTAPATAPRLPLNKTFAEKEDWWKTNNAENFLPDGVSFDEKKNVLFNLNEMNSSESIFLRIGSNQPTPTFEFTFAEACYGSSFDLYLNDNLAPGCRIGITVVTKGFTVFTAATGRIDKLIPDKTYNPSFVFDAEALYVKAKDPVSIHRLPICKIVNQPTDQLAIRVSQIAGDSCSQAKLSLQRSDVAATGLGIEVLVDRRKLPAPLTSPQPADDASKPAEEMVTTAAATTESPADDASFPWYYVVAGVFVILIPIAIIVAIVCIVNIRRRRAQKKKVRIASPPAVSEVKTAVPLKAEAPKPKKPQDEKKSEKPQDEKKSEKVDAPVEPEVPLSDAEIKSKRHARMMKKINLLKEQASEKAAKPHQPVEEERSTQKHRTRRQRQRTEGTEDSMPSLPLQDGTLEVRTTQEETVGDKPLTLSKDGLPPRPAQPKNLRKLRLCFLYGGDGASMDKPFDYHAGESATFESTLLSSAAHSWSTPDLKNLKNFWDCVKHVVEPKRFSAVYVNAKYPGKNVFFMIRDIVADEGIHAPFLSLSNRMLEPLKKDLIAAGKSTPTEDTFDGQKKYCLLRVFILSYEPLTLEIHSRGQCPMFMFDLFECDACPSIAKELERNAWLNSSGTCRDDWNDFVCRVKRTPMNTHQFLSYNGGQKPKSSDEVNHMLVIRGGDQKRSSNKLRPCIRGCKFSDSSHPNQFTIEASLSSSQTPNTQRTQNSTTTLATQATQNS